MSYMTVHEFGDNLYEEEPCIRCPEEGEVYLDLAGNPTRAECNMGQMMVVLKKIER